MFLYCTIFHINCTNHCTSWYSWSVWLQKVLLSIAHYFAQNCKSLNQLYCTQCESRGHTLYSAILRNALLSDSAIRRLGKSAGSGPGFRGAGWPSAPARMPAAWPGWTRQKCSCCCCVTNIHESRLCSALPLRARPRLAQIGSLHRQPNKRWRQSTDCLCHNRRIVSVGLSPWICRKSTEIPLWRHYTFLAPSIITWTTLQHRIRSRLTADQVTGYVIGSFSWAHCAHCAHLCTLFGLAAHF